MANTVWFEQLEERRDRTPRGCWLPETKVFVTPQAKTALTLQEVLLAVGRHVSGDWGAVDEFDWKQNDIAVEEGSRVLSVYVTEGNTRFWVITETDRSVTTVLLPDDN